MVQYVRQHFLWCEHVLDPFLAVTGGSSGFGLEVTKTVLRNSEIAAITVRAEITPELAELQATYGTSSLLILQCNVADDGQIRRAFAEAIAKFGRCDVVFNNAGCTLLSEIEGTPEHAARAMFDVNFWGAANVSREAVRVFREVNPPKEGGMLLNVSSGAGVVPNAGIGYYSARLVIHTGLRCPYLIFSRGHSKHGEI